MREKWPKMMSKLPNRAGVGVDHAVDRLDVQAQQHHQHLQPPGGRWVGGVAVTVASGSQ